MREFLALVFAFTLGALCVEVKSQREINALESSYLREQARLMVDVEGSYRDGIEAGCYK